MPKVIPWIAGLLFGHPFLLRYECAMSSISIIKTIVKSHVGREFDSTSMGSVRDSLKKSCRGHVVDFQESITNPRDLFRTHFLLPPYLAAGITTNTPS